MFPFLFDATFFLGILEVSTAILWVLANFDDEYGVKGLRDAIPMVKLVMELCLCVRLSYAAPSCGQSAVTAFCKTQD
jgi:hypothetical protein